MNPFLAFCSKCFLIPGSSNQFFITSCGNVICQQCLGPQGNCNKCGRDCLRKLISSQMSADVATFFKDLSIEFQRFLKTGSFQMNRYKSYIKYVTARMASMERALHEGNRKIHALELEKRALQTSINKLKESNNFLKQKQQQSFHVSNSPAMDRQSSTFVNNVMNAIERGRNGGNDTTSSAVSSSCGIFPREPPARHSFDNRSNNRSIDTPHLPRPIRFHNQFPTNRQNFKSTPVIGHERIGRNNFANFGRNKQSSSIMNPSSRYHR